MTATFISASDARPSVLSRLGRGTGRPGREDENDNGRDAHQNATCDVQGVVHSAIHACRGNERHHRESGRPGERPKDAAREPGRQQEDETAVDSNRSRRMTGRVARVDRQVLETSNARPVRVDDECRGAVRRRLDDQREHDERGEPPLPQHGTNERDRSDNDRKHHSSGDDRAKQ